MQRQLEAQEGRKRDVYRDSRGYWSIGIGHLISKDTTLTADQARAIVAAPWTDKQIDAQFVADFDRETAAIRHAKPWIDELPELVQEGIYDQCFQLGAGGSLAFHDMWAALEAARTTGDFAPVEAAALNSLWHKQTPTRCQHTAAMLGNRAA